MVNHFVTNSIGGVNFHHQLFLSQPIGDEKICRQIFINLI